MPSYLETAILNPSEDLLDLTKSVPSPGIHIDTRSIEEVALEKIQSMAGSRFDADVENAFFVGDLGEVFRQHVRWKALLPRIEPFFAVKCNPDPMIINLLASLGIGFDCASKTEIQQVLDAGVEPQRIIYANPCKQASFIRYAAHQNVSRMTFDNAEELHKIKKHYPEAELVIRILTDDSNSLCQLGLKFGAPLNNVQSLLTTAKELGLNVVGVSFHVGSGCLDASAFSDAVMRARAVFDQAKTIGFDFTLLDVGGGFPGSDIKDGITFEKVAAVLGPIVDSLFPSHIRVIAEPGRYYVSSAFTLCTGVIGRRKIEPATEQAQPEYMYYVNDGMYGSFNCIIFDHRVVYPKVLVKDETFTYGLQIEGPHYQSSVWGPTCDSIDCLNKAVRLPILESGDWLYYEDMGAYTVCAASQFNGFRKSEVLLQDNSLVKESVIRLSMRL
ncbi:pyridoxal-dependent decarboxylase [Sporodiniella umbellata]|nr:pyridoxal-dependent decarboxylase [Sporodiniella umbellata]